jgi:hypothetical protein
MSDSLARCSGTIQNTLLRLGRQFVIGQKSDGTIQNLNNFFYAVDWYSVINTGVAQ